MANGAQALTAQPWVQVPNQLQVRQLPIAVMPAQGQPITVATVDQGATIIESLKQAALAHYDDG